MTGDYTAVTETWGLPASPEQLAMQYFRYRMGAELAPGGAVLEVGCGSGMGLPYLEAHARMTVGGDYAATFPTRISSAWGRSTCRSWITLSTRC